MMVAFGELLLVKSATLLTLTLLIREGISEKEAHLKFVKIY
jgi:hypothetical protein